MTTETLAFAPKSVMVRKDLDIRAGDTVRVHVKIQEKGKTRTQIFEGLVLARKHGSEPGATFTVRKISNGVGVERIFPLYSPMLEKIEIVKRSRVRRAKLYYIREKVAREVRRKMRNFVNFFATTDDLVIPADEMMDETPDEVTTPDADEQTAEETPREPVAQVTVDDNKEEPAEETQTESTPQENKESEA